MIEDNKYGVNSASWGILVSSILYFAGYVIGVNDLETMGFLILAFALLHHLEGHKKEFKEDQS